jgi:hypothetical protein
MEIWPNFFIIGGARSGTTSLYEYLKDTKGVFLPESKELNYFCTNINPKLLLTKIIDNKQEYLNFFKNVKDEKVIGDASPLYLWDPKSPKLIHDTIPHAKFITIIRNPVDRAYSHFLQSVTYGTESYPFSECIKKSLVSPSDYSGRIIEGGLYSEQIKRYFDIFSKNQVRVYFYEEFFKDPHYYMKDMLNFLGVNEELPESIGKIHNALVVPKGGITDKIIKSNLIKNLGKKIIPKSSSMLVKNILFTNSTKPQMELEDRKFLEKFYRDDIKKLETLLERNIPWKI